MFSIKHVSNIDIDEWQLGVIDKNGNVISPFKEYSMVYETEPYNIDEGIIPFRIINGECVTWYDDPTINFNEREITVPLKKEAIRKCNYLGNDILKLACCPEYNDEDDYDFDEYCDFLINMKTQNIIYASVKDGYITLYSDYENGSATVLKDGFLGKIDTDGNITETLNNSWTAKVLSSNCTFSEGLEFFSLRNYDITYTDFTLKSGVYYDIEGNVVIDIEKYHGKNYYKCEPFSNGYAVMCIKGADEKDYYTVINQKGEQLFEPMSGYTKFMLSNDSTCICAVKNNTIEIFDLYGKKISTIKTRELNGMVNKSVNDDMVRLTDCYINVRTGQLIGSGKFSLTDLDITIYR